jgi:hypothetical protein
MNDLAGMSTANSGPEKPAFAPVFISHSSKDRAAALKVCKALEARGLACWVACRDVGLGDNFQEAIVRAIRSAKVMVLIFTNNANHSKEIQKELALASRLGLTVIPARVENVDPSEALVYELATRQWIDVYENWDEAMERLSSALAVSVGASATPPIPRTPSRPERKWGRPSWTWLLLVGGVIGVLASVIFVANWQPRDIITAPIAANPAPSPAPTMPRQNANAPAPLSPTSQGENATPAPPPAQSQPAKDGSNSYLARDEPSVPAPPAPPRSRSPDAPSSKIAKDEPSLPASPAPPKARPSDKITGSSTFGDEKPTPPLKARPSDKITGSSTFGDEKPTPPLKSRSPDKITGSSTFGDGGPSSLPASQIPGLAGDGR